MPDNRDGASPIRPGEELPLDVLRDYLQKNLPEAAGSLVVEQFAHGHQCDQAHPGEREKRNPWCAHGAASPMFSK